MKKPQDSSDCAGLKRQRRRMLCCRAAHEEGDHAEAVLLCVDCFHGVDSLGMCKVRNRHVESSGCMTNSCHPELHRRCPLCLRSSVDHAGVLLPCSLQIAPALQVSVQRAYYDAMQQLHTALLNVCADFQGENYSKVRPSGSRQAAVSSAHGFATLPRLAASTPPCWLCTSQMVSSTRHAAGAG